MAVRYMLARSTSVDSTSLGSGGTSGTCSRPEEKRSDPPSRTRAPPAPISAGIGRSEQIRRLGAQLRLTHGPSRPPT